LSVSLNPTFQLKPSRSFVYGSFRWPKEREGVGVLEQILRPSDPDVALEILREYGPSEMLGRIHVIAPGSNWTRLSPSDASRCRRYTFYLQNHRDVFFEMKGSGVWQVANFQNESDETGSYVAVALIFQSSKSPDWLSPIETARRPLRVPSGRKWREATPQKNKTPRPQRS